MATDKRPIELEEGWTSMQVPGRALGFRIMQQPHAAWPVHAPADGSCAACICHLQQGIKKLIRLLENEPEAQFNAEQYMMLYT
jgi:hypothetical protein